MEELLEAPQLGSNPHLPHTLSTLMRKGPKKLAENGYFLCISLHAQIQVQVLTN